MVVFVAFAAFSTPAWAGKDQCDLVGSWTGYPDGPMFWTAVHLATDKAGNEGVMQMNLVASPSLLTWYGQYSTVTHLTLGEGVWKKKGSEYLYTWYAYGVDSYGYPVYSLRISGKAKLMDCDSVSIVYAYELFNGVVLAKDMLSENAAHGTAGEAVEYRNTLFMWPVYP